MEVWVLLLSLTALVTITWIVSWFRKLRKLRLDLSLLPGYRGNPILGDFHFLIGKSFTAEVPFHAALHQTILAFSTLYQKEGLCKIWIMHLPHVLLFSAETMEPILSSSMTIDKSGDYKLLQCWLGTGLLTSNGSKWKKRRKLITPTFHYSILDGFIPIFDHHSKIFVKQLEKLNESEWIDIVPLIRRFTLDIICETAMAVKLRAQEKGSCEYVDAIAYIGAVLMERSIKPWLENDTIFFLTPEGRKTKKALRVLHGFTSQIVKKRKEEMLNDKEATRDSKVEDDEFRRKKKLAFLDMLLRAQLLDNSMTDADICEEVDTFMFEGHDTTAMGISWALFHLGHHPQVQEKIHQELKQIFGNAKNREITLQDLKEMKYLECAIKECERLSPSVPAISREIKEDIKIKNYKVPSGTTIILSIYSLHRDPDVFLNPEVFDPDRFLPENSLGRHPFAFLPFSAGSRNCIGQKFAMNEMKISLCNVIRNFIVESLDPIDKVVSSAVLVLRAENGLRMRFLKRV